MNSINLDTNSKNIISCILNKNLQPQIKVYVFGSRAKCTSKQYADLDLALESDEIIDSTIIDKLHIEFEDSMLPFKVDIIDLKNIDEDFYNAIVNDLVIWN